jgi:hypothetical protein
LLSHGQYKDAEIVSGQLEAALNQFIILKQIKIDIMTNAARPCKPE